MEKMKGKTKFSQKLSEAGWTEFYPLDFRHILMVDHRHGEF
jgi:hypothetical protein